MPPTYNRQGRPPQTRRRASRKFVTRPFSRSGRRNKRVWDWASSASSGCVRRKRCSRDWWPISRWTVTWCRRSSEESCKASPPAPSESGGGVPTMDGEPLRLPVADYSKDEPPSALSVSREHFASRLPKLFGKPTCRAISTEIAKQ